MTAKRPPNIVYIYADDLGRGMLSSYGQRHFQTPGIDRIAAEGVRFTNSYSCAFCAPARASLITGRHDSHHGSWTFTTGQSYKAVDRGLVTLEELQESLNNVSLAAAEGEVFLPEVARQAGLATAQIGKLEWGFATTPQRIRRHGWDYHYGYYDHGRCHGFYPPYLWEDGRRVEIPGNTRSDCGKHRDGESPENRAIREDRVGKVVYSQDLFDEKILTFLRSHRDTPFYLHHPSQLPHGPISIPEIHPALRGVDGLTDYEKEYASMVLRLDQTVTMVLDELERLGIRENTVVMFSADNGHAPYYQEAGRMNPRVNLRTGETYDNVTTKFYTELSGDVFNGNDGMAGLKFTSWEGGTRVAQMASWPGVTPPGSVSDDMVACYDWMATMADILGVARPATTDGVSYRRALAQPGSGGRSSVVYGSPLGPALVTADGWKLRTVNSTRRYQLYHLPDDYREEHDVAADHPEIVSRLGRELLAECGYNLLNGTPEAHHVYLPGLELDGPGHVSHLPKF